jgi:hypothetical protein
MRWLSHSCFFLRRMDTSYTFECMPVNQSNAGELHERALASFTSVTNPSRRQWYY